MKRHRWSKEEIDLLKLNYPKFGSKYCSKSLNIHHTVVGQCARRHGLKINWIKEEQEGTKTCGHCKDKKLLIDFHKNKRRMSGISDICKKCKSKIQKKWNNEHKIEIRNYGRKRRKDTYFRLISNLRTRINKALKRKKKTDHTLILIGCSINKLKDHLESKFLSNMSWNNYGKYGWHVDHIIPCASFDLSNPEEQQKCFHYTNLQPLWEDDNLRKGAKINVALQRQI